MDKMKSAMIMAARLYFFEIVDGFEEEQEAQQERQEKDDG